MHLNKSFYTSLYTILAVTLLLVSCEKVDIEFKTTDPGNDPNITYTDNYAVDIGTFKPDSFITSGHQIFSIGYHKDPVFGNVQAGSYVQLDLPTNNIFDKNVSFDSLELILKPNGNFYGDSSLPIKISVHELTEKVNTENINGYFYNTSSLSYKPTPLCQQSITVYGQTGSVISVRLPDTLGQRWLEMFRTNDENVSTQDFFINYFKGLYITADSTATNTIGYFSPGTDSALIRLHYHELGLFSEAKVINFQYTAAKQFNHISFNYTNAAFASFIPNKKQDISSDLSAHQAFLNSNMMSYIKISFPDLLRLKESHPYIKVLKAQLIIKPTASSYLAPYQLPSTLYLYTADESNTIVSAIYQTNLTTPTLQTGNLVIDELYGDDTRYTYDITSFINQKLSEGQFSNSSLLLSTSQSYGDAGIQRLIVNDQQLSSSVQLQMYVLGL